MTALHASVSQFSGDADDYTMALTTVKETLGVDSVKSLEEDLQGLGQQLKQTGPNVQYSLNEVRSQLDPNSSSCLFGTSLTLKNEVNPSATNLKEAVTSVKAQLSTSPADDGKDFFQLLGEASQSIDPTAATLQEGVQKASNITGFSASLVSNLTSAQSALYATLMQVDTNRTNATLPALFSTLSPNSTLEEMLDLLFNANLTQ